MFLFDGAIYLHKDFLSCKERLFTCREKTATEVEVFPMGIVGGQLVSAAPAQANYITEHCI